MRVSRARRRKRRTECPAFSQGRVLGASSLGSSGTGGSSGSGSGNGAPSSLGRSFLGSAKLRH